MDNIDNDTLPVILYLHGADDDMKDSIALDLQDYYAGRYRIVAPDLITDYAHPVPLTDDWVKKVEPRLIVGWGPGGNLAIKCDRDENVDVVVVNPLIDESLEEIPLYKFSKVFALCSTKDEVAGDSHLTAFLTDYKSVRVTTTDSFGHYLNESGMKLLFSLIDNVIDYQKSEQKLMTYEEFEDMVRHRPSPDNPGYFSLKVFTFDKDGFSKETVNGQLTYRCPLSSREAEFPTKKEALATMQNIIASTSERICMFLLVHLPFGRFDKALFPIEEWTFDSTGKIILEAACSVAHYHESGIHGKFFGYFPEKMPWSKGDIVGIQHRYFGDNKDYATLAVVVETPKDITEGYSDYLSATRQWIRDGNNPESWLDLTYYPGYDDDEMFLQFGPYNEDMTNFTFRSPITMFPIPLGLPEDVKTELLEWYNSGELIITIENDYNEKE